MVLFSTGTETYGYLTAMVAVGIWYVKTPTQVTTPRLNLFLLIFCILLTSLSTTDLFPRFIRMDYVKPYALKAFALYVNLVKNSVGTIDSELRVFVGENRDFLTKQ